jgi:hypothetical protein
MSQETVVEVITKALVDTEFRSQLLAEPAAALSGYDLTEEERESLTALQEDAFDAFASEVEERVSKVTPITLPLPVPPEVNLDQIADVEQSIQTIVLEEEILIELLGR